VQLTKLNLLKFSFFLGLGILVIWLALHNRTDAEITNTLIAFKEADYFWVGFSILLSILSHIARCLRWKILLAPLGHKPSLLNTFFALMIGYMANFALPRLGEVSRCGILTKYENIPFTQGFGTVVAERIIDLICLLLIFFTTLYFQFDQLWKLSNELIIAPVQQKLEKVIDNNSTVLISITVLSLLAVIGMLLFRKKNNADKQNKPSKMSELLSGFINGLETIKDIKNPILFFGYTVFIWALYVGALLVGFRCFPETSNLGVDAGMAVLIFSTVGVMVTPGGTGASQVLIEKALTSVFSITIPFAIATGWLIWGAQFISLLFLGIVSAILLPIVNKNK
jgi:glycosyltransferase 2 family protein